jgi:hypothetical protein
MKHCIQCGVIDGWGHHYYCPQARQETVNALAEIQAAKNEKPEYPRNVTAFIQKWQPVEDARRKAFWKEFRKAANAYSEFKHNA